MCASSDPLPAPAPAPAADGVQLQPADTPAAAAAHAVDIPPAGSAGDASVAAAFTTVALSFTDVTKFVPDAASETGLRQVLHGVSGSARPGELLALMGPSGSGKTTLLNTFHPERAGAHVGGEICLNGHPLEKAMKRKISYVWQEDVLYVSLTTKESLEYTARLRLAGPESAKLAAAAKAMATLGLDRCANTPIMLLSGGEKKRVSIATELLTDPALILLDEPTSGLDAASAQTLVQALRELAAEGHTVVSSIHQPSSRIFFGFDKMLLLADGRTCFYGRPQDTSAWFEAAGYPVPPNFNPADHIMDVVNAPGGAAEARATLIARFDDAIAAEGSLVGSPKASTSAKELPPRIASKAVERPSRLATSRSLKGLVGGGDSGEAAREPKWPTSWAYQLAVLTHRDWRLSWAANISIINIAQCLILSVMVSLFWLRMDWTESRAPDRAAFGFFAGIFWPFQVMFSSLMTFPSTRDNLERERAAGSYRLSAYFISKIGAEAPFQLLYPTVYAIITWWASGVRDSARSFFGVLGITYVNVLAAGGIGLVVGTTLRDFRQQLMVATLFMLGTMLLGGFFITTLPSWLDWAQYLSFMRYMYNVTLYLIFDIDTPCDGSGALASCDGSDTGVATPSEVLDEFGVTTSPGLASGVLLAFAAVSRVMAYLALRFVDTSVGRS